MNKYLSRRGALWIGLFSGISLLIVIALAFPSSAKPTTVTARIDSEGVAHLGPIPLRNDRVRKLAFFLAHRAWPDRRFEVVAATGDLFAAGEDPLLENPQTYHLSPRSSAILLARRTNGQRSQTGLTEAK